MQSYSDNLCCVLGVNYVQQKLIYGKIERNF